MLYSTLEPPHFAPASWPAGSEAPFNAGGVPNDGGPCSPSVVPSAEARHFIRLLLCGTCGWRTWLIEGEEPPHHPHTVMLFHSTQIAGRRDNF